MATETNGRSRVSWPTFFAGVALFLAIGTVIVNSLVSQWGSQFAALNKQIEHEREVTELKLRISELTAQVGTVTAQKDQQKEHLEAELAKFKKEPPVTITTTQPLPVTK